MCSKGERQMGQCARSGGAAVVGSRGPKSESQRWAPRHAGLAYLPTVSSTVTLPSSPWVRPTLTPSPSPPSAASPPFSIAGAASEAASGAGAAAAPVFQAPAPSRREIQKNFLAAGLGIRRWSCCKATVRTLAIKGECVACLVAIYQMFCTSNQWFPVPTKNELQGLSTVADHTQRQKHAVEREMGWLTTRFGCGGGSGGGGGCTPRGCLCGGGLGLAQLERLGRRLGCLGRGRRTCMPPNAPSLRQSLYFLSSVSS